MPLDSQDTSLPPPLGESLNNEEPLRLVKTLQENLEGAYQYYWEKGESHYFYRAGIGSIHCRSFISEENKKLLVISPGRAESSVKYSELALELKGQGFDIVVVDHRGQGFSEKCSRAGNRGFVDSFKSYCRDFHDVIQHFKEKKKYKKTLVLAHSMGSAIALGAERLSPGLTEGMVLSSPMLRVKTRQFPEWVAFLALRGMAKTFWPYHVLTEAEAKDRKTHFKNNIVTSSPERFHFSRDLEKRHPQITCDGPTINWLSEALGMGRYLWRERKKFDRPLLLMQAENDFLVCNQVQDRFAHEVNNCRLIRLKESRHEILQETDSIRNRALVQIHKFLKES